LINLSNTQPNWDAVKSATPILRSCSIWHIANLPPAFGHFYVGQDGILRPIGNRPVANPNAARFFRYRHSAFVVGRPIVAASRPSGRLDSLESESAG
jgi:hypothetical protein